MKSMVERIASQKFSRRRPDDSIVEWQQEDETAVTSKAEAVAMVQRAIDFWVPKAASDLHAQRGIPKAKARILARQGAVTAMLDLSTPFARRWNLQVKDFNFDVPD